MTSFGFCDCAHQVELVRAPEGSVVGERARVEGSEGEPMTPAQVTTSENIPGISERSTYCIGHGGKQCPFFRTVSRQQW